MTPRSPEAAHNERLLALLSRLPKAKVAVLGDLVADEYVSGETDRVSREAPVLIVRYESSRLVAGCAGNAVMNLCALGARVRPIGVVGSDAAGKRLVQMLKKAGADTDGIVTVRGAATATKMRILAGGKNTRRQQIVRLDRDGPGAPHGEALKRLTAALDDAARTCDAILISDYGLGLLTALRDRALTHTGKVQVCVDARYDLKGYRGVRLIKPNEVELEQAVGKRLDGSLDELERAGRSLLETQGVGALLVTRGKNGMALLEPESLTQIVPAHGTHEAVDVTGAGDTVMSVTTLGLASGADPLLAAQLANVAGALVVQKLGTATVSAEELQRELSETLVTPPHTLKPVAARPRSRS
ncbi:MAG: sugar kinase [Deltaproteobacteria bacterium]|nr:sugar kinase [Deltaproteobacteria bacterium]